MYDVQQVVLLGTSHSLDATSPLPGLVSAFPYGLVLEFSLETEIDPRKATSWVLVYVDIEMAQIDQ